MINMKEYAVKMGLQNIGKKSSKELLGYLNSLAYLDQDIKSGRVDPKEGFDLFLLRKSYASNTRII